MLFSQVLQILELDWLHRIPLIISLIALLIIPNKFPRRMFKIRFLNYFISLIYGFNTILVPAIIVFLVLVPASFFVRVQSLQIQKLLILVSDVSLLGHVAVILLDHVWHEGLKEQFLNLYELI